MLWATQFNRIWSILARSYRFLSWISGFLPLLMSFPLLVQTRLSSNPRPIISSSCLATRRPASPSSTVWSSRRCSQRLPSPVSSRRRSSSHFFRHLVQAESSRILSFFCLEFNFLNLGQSHNLDEGQSTKPRAPNLLSQVWGSLHMGHLPA